MPDVSVPRVTVLALAAAVTATVAVSVPASAQQTINLTAISGYAPPIAMQWAEAQDKKGLPGTPILKAWMDEMRAKNQPVARNWDVE